MYVVSTCALPVASWLWQPRPSAWALTVICRGTFLLRPMECALAPDQEPPIEDDQHHGGDDRLSLHAASDLAPMKPRADVTLVGHAYSPSGGAVSSLIARLRVGELDKAIEIHSERYFDQEGSLHEGARFSRMPLVYERAAGGPESWNPVGVRAQPDAYGRVALPNFQPPGLSIASPADHIPPIGMGPIAPSWPARRERLGRHAYAGLPDGQREPLPEDFDFGFWNHAPRDQQIAALRADERIVLENLHPEIPRLVTSLPGIRPRAVVEYHRGSLPVSLRCDTLWIDTDRGICTLTWRGQVPLDSPEEDGRVVFSLENGGASHAPSPPAMHEVGRRQAEAAESTTGTLVPGVSARTTAASRVLPFGPGRGPSNPTPAGGLPFVGAPDVPPAKPSAPSFGAPPAMPSFGAPPAVPAAPSFGAPPAAAAPTAPSSSFGGRPPTSPPPAPAGSFGGVSVPAPAPVRIPAPQPSAPSSFWSVPEAPSSPVSPQAPMTVGQMAANTDIVAPAPPPVPAPQTAPPEPTRVTGKVVVEAKKAIQLVWFDPACLPRVRRKTAWRPLLEGIEERPIDADLDDPSIARDPVTIEDRRDLFEVLARAEPADENKLPEAIEKGLRDDGKFVAPFLVVVGELRMPFDELLALKASISIASPFAPNDEALKASITDARELLEIPDLVCPPAVFEGFTTRIHEAFRKMRRAAAPAGYLEEAVERTLLEKRSYQKREVFGGPHLRGLLTVGSTPRPWPLYLPDSVAKRLPMFVKFQARLLIEGWLQEDQYEQHPAALKACALARVTPMPSLSMPKPPPAKS